MNGIEPYSIRVRHVPALPSCPWLAELCDSDRGGDWIIRARAASVTNAIVRLSEQARKLGISNDRLALICATAVIHTSRPTYDNDMADVDDTGDQGDAGDVMPTTPKRYRCVKCNITDRYADGTLTHVSDRADRFGVMRKMCHICGLKEQLAQMEATRRQQPVTAKAFDAWLTPGDRVRAHAAGVALEGPLPEPTEAQLTEFKVEYERSY